MFSAVMSRGCVDTFRVVLLSSEAASLHSTYLFCVRFR